MVPADDHFWPAGRVGCGKEWPVQPRVPHRGDRVIRLTHRPVCFSMSSIFVWNTGSTASTDTPVPLCGIAKTSTRTRVSTGTRVSTVLQAIQEHPLSDSPMTRTVYSSTKSPSMSPITSSGTPARPCLSICAWRRCGERQDRTSTSASDRTQVGGTSSERARLSAP